MYLFWPEVKGEVEEETHRLAFTRPFVIATHHPDSLSLLGSCCSLRRYIYRDHTPTSSVPFLSRVRFLLSIEIFSPSFSSSRVKSCMLVLFSRTLSHIKLPRPRILIQELSQHQQHRQPLLSRHYIHSATVKMASQTFKLNSGYEIPAVALGMQTSSLKRPILDRNPMRRTHD